MSYLVSRPNPHFNGAPEFLSVSGDFTLHLDKANAFPRFDDAYKALLWYGLPRGASSIVSTEFSALDWFSKKFDRESDASKARMRAASRSAS